MTDLAGRLTELGIQRAEQTIEIARSVGLELAIACVLLEKESGGGRNIWGHDSVSTAGTYTKGGPVTPDNYAAYQRARRAGRAGAQGCGPTQLTYPPLQESADRAGGCWDPTVNTRVGLAHLQSLQAAHGLRGGFRRYNGNGPAAERYADHAMLQLRVWRTRLGSSNPDGPPPTPQQEDDSMALSEVDRQYLNQRFADIWRVLGVRAGDDGTERDRLTDLWDRLATVEAKLDQLLTLLTPDEPTNDGPTPDAPPALSGSRTQP